MREIRHYTARNPGRRIGLLMNRQQHLEVRIRLLEKQLRSFDSVSGSAPAKGRSTETGGGFSNCAVPLCL